MGSNQSTTSEAVQTNAPLLRRRSSQLKHPRLETMQKRILMQQQLLHLNDSPPILDGLLLSRHNSKLSVVSNTGMESKQGSMVANRATSTMQVPAVSFTADATQKASVPERFLRRHSAHLNRNRGEAEQQVSTRHLSLDETQLGSPTYQFHLSSSLSRSPTLHVLDLFGVKYTFNPLDNATLTASQLLSQLYKEWQSLYEVQDLPTLESLYLVPCDEHGSTAIAEPLLGECTLKGDERVKEKCDIYLAVQCREVDETKDHFVEPELPINEKLQVNDKVNDELNLNEPIPLSAIVPLQELDPSPPTACYSHEERYQRQLLRKKSQRANLLYDLVPSPVRDSLQQGKKEQKRGVQRMSRLNPESLALHSPQQLAETAHLYRKSLNTNTIQQSLPFQTLETVKEAPSIEITVFFEDATYVSLQIHEYTKSHHILKQALHDRFLDTTADPNLCLGLMKLFNLFQWILPGNQKQGVLVALDPDEYVYNVVVQATLDTSQESRLLICHL